MKITKCISAFTSILLLVLISSAKLSLANDIVIPSEGQGIFVNAICGKGCAGIKSPLDVYILNNVDFKKYKANKKDIVKKDIVSRGKTPFVANVLVPGIYHVAIETKLDSKVVPMKGGIYPEPQQPDYESFFANDLAEMLVQISRVAPSPTGGYKMAYFLQKWYRVTVSEKHIEPVVAIFVPKDETPIEWQKYYPDKSHFINNTPKEAQEVFWQEISKIAQPFKSKIDQSLLLELLEKGGRVCIPNTPVVISLDGRGWLTMAVASLGSTTFVGTVQPSVSPKMRYSVQQDSKTTSGLPPFQNALNGSIEVRIKNPNDFNVSVGLRKGDSGKDFVVNANTSRSVHVSDGDYNVYFIYSNEPKTLYRGDSFTLKNNGIEIQIVQVVDGNYSIHKVK